MTRDEVKLCFAIDFIADGAEEFEGVFELQGFSTPKWEQSDSWVEHLRRVMRYLNFVHEYEFEFVECFENGSIRRRGDFIEPRNVLYTAGLLNNQVNYLSAMKTAERMRRREPALATLPRNVFREAQDYIEQSIAQGQAMVNPDRHQLWSAEMDECLGSIGIVRKERVNGPAEAYREAI